MLISRVKQALQIKVVHIIQSGLFSEAVYAAGGTVINARGTSNAEAEKLFNIVIQPEKEMVLIIVEPEIKNDILHALYKAVGLDTPGHGIAFSLPIDNAVGLPSGELHQE